MTRSANEVMVLATKAARGAGAPPAQAAQFGAAVAVHLCAGRSIGIVCDAIVALPLGPIIDIPVSVSSIAEQALDGRAAGEIDATNAEFAVSYLEALPYHGYLDESGGVQLDFTKPAARTPFARIDLPPQIYEEWVTLAARILVPESEASRLSGAGAGLSDND